MTRPAVFLDRDETIIDDPGFLSEPDGVRLKPGAADGIRRLREAGYAIVVASNQSGVARGLMSESDVQAVNERLRSLLRREGAGFDAAYYCPYLDGPDAVVEAYRRDSELRKPNPGMLQQAAADLGIDLARSWMIGDRPTDVEAGRRAGCHTIFIAPGGREGDNGEVGADFRAGSLLEAAAIVEQQTPHRSETPPEETRPSDDSTVAVLSEIRDLLDRQQRTERQADFSFLRLFGTLTQMLAVVLAIWGVFALFDPQSADFASARFALAAFLQLVTLTTYIAEQRR